MATIFDLARECGVSIATVSRALNGRGDVAEDTRQVVLSAASRMGYRPSPTARGLKLKRTRTLGVLVSSFETLQCPVPSEMLRGIGETAEQKGYRLLLHSLWRNGERSLDPVAAMAEHHVDGVLCFEPGQAPDAALLASLKAPMVLVNYASASLPSVSSDNRAGARLAVQHLLSLGHRQIGILRGPIGHQAADERWQGWHDALREAGVAPDERWAIAGPFSGYAELSSAAEEAAANRLLDQAPELTAVLASSDLMALGLFRSAQAKGLRIPEQLSVIAFDDSWVGRSCQPALSSVRQDPYKMGVDATELLMRMLEKGAHTGADQASQVVVPVSLALRQSTARPRVV